jgi:hypothetical protein
MGWTCSRVGHPYIRGFAGGLICQSATWRQWEEDDTEMDQGKAGCETVNWIDFVDDGNQ